MAAADAPANTSSSRWHWPDLHIPSWLPRPSVTVIVITCLALFEAIALTWLQWQNYLSFLTLQGDLGNYNQAFWTTVHRQGFFYYTTNIPGGSGGTLWAVHFSPFLILLLPFYALAPSPVTLLFLKQIALALGAVPLYGIARVYFKGNAIPVLFSLLYLLSPVTMTTDWNSFDPEVFLPLTLLVSLYFFAKGRYWPFLFTFLLALSTIEATPPLLMLFAVGGLVGTYLAPSLTPYWTSRRQRRALLIALGVATVWFIIAFLALSAAGPRGGGFGDAYASRYSVLGATTIPDVLPRALTHPAAASAALNFQGSQKVQFIELILLASGAVSLFGGLRYLLPVLAYLALAVLSNNTAMYAFGSEYVALLSAFLFVAAVEGALRVSNFLGRADTETRRSELTARLAADARQLIGQIGSLPITSARRARAVERVRWALARLDEGELGPAEAELARVHRLVTARSLRHYLAKPRVSVSGEASPPSASARVVALARRVKYVVDHGDRTKLVPTACAAVCILVACGLSNPVVGPRVDGNFEVLYGNMVPNAHEVQLLHLLKMIPANASVLTTGHLFPELSSRRNAYVVQTAMWLPDPKTVADDYLNWGNHSQFAAIDFLVDDTSAVILENDTNLTGFGVFASEGGTVIFERGWQGPPAVWAPWNTSFAGGRVHSTLGYPSPEFASSLGPSFYHPPEGTMNASLWNTDGLVYLPLGNYTVTFNVELIAPIKGPEVALHVGFTPVWVNDNPLLTVAHETYYAPMVAAAPVPPTLLNHTTIVAKTSFTSPTQFIRTLAFNLTNPGFVTFPAIELSTSMSLYLVSIKIAQQSASA